MVSTPSSMLQLQLPVVPLVAVAATDTSDSIIALTVEEKTPNKIATVRIMANSLFIVNPPLQLVEVF